jgi:hypothetical protein
LVPATDLLLVIVTITSTTMSYRSEYLLGRIVPVRYGPRLPKVIDILEIISLLYLKVI